MPDIKYTPCVILPGIGQSKVELVNKKGEKVKMAWPLDVDGEELLGKLKAPLMKMMLFRKDAGFSDKVAQIVEEIVQPISSMPDGSMKNLLRVVSYPQSLKDCTADEKRYIYKMVPLQNLSEKIGEENLFFFAYNSFGDVYETAKELDEFIQNVKKQTGSDKVNLVPVSLGGALSIAYFELFAYKNDIKRVMYFVAALQGTHLVADILDKKIKTQNGISAIELLAGGKTAQSLESMLKMMPDGVFEATVDKALDVLIDTAVVNSTAMWGLVPPERYEVTAGKYLSDKKHAELKEKTDRFFRARLNFKNTVRELENGGIEFFAVCGYGLPLLPLIESDKMSSDGIINISSTSLGAVSAPLGEKLSSYPENGRNCGDATHSHLSPDGSLDAAYGMWPERTWYFASQSHDATAYNDKALGVAARVLSDDTFTDIYSDPEFPQFGSAQDNRK